MQLGCIRYELILCYFPGETSAGQDRGMQQARYPPSASFWVFSSRLSFLLTLACTPSDHSYSLISLINVNIPRCENYLLKQGSDSDVQEHFKSSGDHLVSSLLLNFPLPTLQNKCNIIHFHDSFNINIWYLYLWYKYHNHHLCGKQELAPKCNRKEPKNHPKLQPC